MDLLLILITISATGYMISTIYDFHQTSKRRKNSVPHVPEEAEGLL